MHHVIFLPNGYLTGIGGRVPKSFDAIKSV